METAELRLKLSTNGDIMEEKLTFEENMNKLGQVVAQLEKGDIPLEKAVEMILSGEITDAKTQAAVLKLKLLKDKNEL